MLVLSLRAQLHSSHVSPGPLAVSVYQEMPLTGPASKSTTTRSSQGCSNTANTAKEAQ